MTKSGGQVTSHQRTDVMPWRRRSKEVATFTVNKLAEELAASGVPEKVEKLVQAVKAQERSAEIEKLRAHDRNYQFQEQQPRRALHLRDESKGLQQFYSLVESSGKRVGK
jgi:cation diffusion facilitator CzcD-associated flavoprotein CzcO